MLISCRKPLVLIIASALMASNNAYSKDPAPAPKSISYLCISKAATGFKFDKELNDWFPSMYRTGTKYILKRNSGKWTWSTFGETFRSDCHPPSKEGYIECSDPFTNILISIRTERFTLVARHGYVQFPTAKRGYDPDFKFEEGSQSPLMELGTCEKIDG